MPPFIFKCPSTGLNVQEWVDDEDGVSDNEFQGLICPACTRLHFLNRKTGRLLGEKDED
jgi:hypothetical protein